MKNFIHVLAFITIGISPLVCAQQGKTQQSIAVVSIETLNMDFDNETMSSMVRLEMMKIDKFEVLDKYYIADALASHQIEPAQCFGKSKVVEAGKILGADKMLTGSVEQFGGKIVVIMRMVDVASEKIERTSVMEYQKVHEELQSMIMISLNDLLDIPNDPHLVDLLIHYNLPITSMKTTVSLTGPRMGMTYTGGINGRRLQDSRDNGGYNMFPVTSMFGYQFEQQYLSSGEFQALVEAIVAINGLESGYLIPSVTFLNGFRFNGRGWEVGIGPTIRLVKLAQGYYNEQDRWIRKQDVPDQLHDGIVFTEKLDRRGTLNISTGLMLAAGKTFRSGYLNIPVNVFFSPRKDGSVLGLTIGFNTTNKPRINKNK